ncbi:MAG: DUF5681 domain-containing protein [Hyphomonadaceae bacterium]|nr:DUF5681 domain-containing protein [Hyphomonadaceae bacterium]
MNDKQAPRRGVSRPETDPPTNNEGGKEHRLPDGRIPPKTSGNPKGRPVKKRKTLGEEVLAELSAKVAITEGGKRKKVSKAVAITKRYSAEALGGDKDAVRMLSGFVRAITGLEARVSKPAAESTPAAKRAIHDDKALKRILIDYAKEIRSQPAPSEEQTA